MIDHVKPENILFLDIETVPQYEDYKHAPAEHQKLWDIKSSCFRNDDQSGADVYKRAGIYAEFGKIICISAGFLHQDKEQRKMRIKSFAGDDEKSILEEFLMMIKAFSEKDFSLCAHNGKEFDFPYIARRILINGLPLPDCLDVAGKKPWEVKFIDTMELWKFGDYKHFTSLDLLSHIFGIPSPKGEMDGSMVGEIYYKEKDLKRIMKYCEKDVITIIQLFLKFRHEQTVPEENISFVA